MTFVKAYTPKDLRLSPDELFISEDQRVFQEYTSMRGWVEEWLSYYKWWFVYYHVVYSYMDYTNPTVKEWIDRITIGDVFDAPIARTDWKLTNVEQL